MFVRLQGGLATTGTFKYRKVDLVSEGFDPERTADPLYVRDARGGYVRITPERYATLAAGTAKL